MTQFDTAELETRGNDLDDRDVRALTEYLTVVPEAPGLYTVTSQSGREYMVEPDAGACTCKDAEYRDPDGGCKHVRRVRFETGRRSLPAWVDDEAIPRDFGAHVDATPTVAATDGGSAEFTERAEALDTGAVIDGETGVLEAAEDDGAEVLEDARPEDCQCTPRMAGLACFPCYREGFEEPNPDAAADEEGR